MPKVISKKNESVVLITGAARRIGRLLALHFAELGGYRLALHYGQSQAAALSLCAELRAREIDCEIFCADLTCSADVSRLMREVKGWRGEATTLIHSAAQFYPTPFFETSVEVFAKMIQVNLLAAFDLLKAWASQLTSPGQAIVMGDRGGLEPWSRHLAYSVSKAALMHLVRSLGKSLGPDLRVNALAPGILIDELGKTDDVAVSKLVRALDWLLSESFSGKIVLLEPLQMSMAEDLVPFR